MQLGILKEGKNPPDKRVAFTPKQCAWIQQEYGYEVLVESSDVRCFKDEAYLKEGVKVVSDVSECAVLMGVKEVPVSALIPNKKYFFFSHTIKKQPYNQSLLQACVNQHIQLIDYECLVDEKKQRVIGFGKHAGIVGAYNALLTYGKKMHLYHLKPANECANFQELIQEVAKINLPAIKISVTGTGRVGKGVIHLLSAVGVKQITPANFLTQTVQQASFCVLELGEYYQKNDQVFEYKDFAQNSASYQSIFPPYLFQSDIYISAHFWDNKAPELFSSTQLAQATQLKVIADITCDIKGSVPSTLRSSTIAQPIYGVDKQHLVETDFTHSSSVAVMAVDNLPCELPADASEDFGNALLNKVLPEFKQFETSILLQQASICKQGKLTEKFSYLQDYYAGKV